MDYLEKCFEKDPNVPTRVIDDEVILVPIRRRLADVNAIYLLRDDVSARIWELIDGKRKVRDIKEIICDEFDVSHEKAENDLIEFFKELEKIGGIIREVGERK
ncbi:MAG: PqqD family protein [bacterium]|nr:PqqD family protein [bacterium]